MQTHVIDIPLNKLSASDHNVRRTGRTLGLDALAASIAAHGLLQNLTVIPVRARNGKETGKYQVIAGGRRLAALKALAEASTIAKDAAVGCLVHDDSVAEEISLAENVMREQLHPADQFEAFKRLVEDGGIGIEEIAARFGVTPAVVRQRLKLAAVSPVLMQTYRDGGLTLEQLMAFTVSDDHSRQIAVWEGLSWNKEPAAIRRAMTCDRVAATDKRAIFVGVEAYEAAGGVIERDLFTEDHGGYFTDPGLLDRLALEKLAVVAESVRAEGWRWASVSLDYPPAHGLKRVYPKSRPLADADQARLDEVSAQYAALAEEHVADDVIPEAMVEGFNALEAEIEALEKMGVGYEPDDIARAGVFVVLEYQGRVRVEAGFVRPGDEPTEAPCAEDDRPDGHGHGGGDAPTVASEGPSDNAPSALSDRLVANLTACRTAALRDAVAGNPQLALLAVTHALALQTFYEGYDPGSCLELRVTSARLSVHAPGVGDSLAGQNIEKRQAAWAARLPAGPALLWAFLTTLDELERLALLAHCAGLGLNAVKAWESRPRALAHADQVARAASLDMAAYWRPTVDSYFGQVAKAKILEAVSEAVSPDAARRLEGLKKAEMAQAAETLVADTGWLPALLRLPQVEGEAQGAA
jgi:ParB family chromosome partitioning protein